MTATHPVFLSYSRSDLAAANELADLLRACGLDLFKDDASLRSGDRWLTRLQEALSGCYAFVVLVGQDGVQRWVGAEVEVALSRHFMPRAAAGGEVHRLPLHPILLGDTEPDALPPFLALFQAVRWQPGQALPEDLKQPLNQFFDQEQFESYLQLGVHVAESTFLSALMDQNQPESIPDWFRQLAKNLLEPIHTPAP